MLRRLVLSYDGATVKPRMFSVQAEEGEMPAWRAWS